MYVSFSDMTKIHATFETAPKTQKQMATHRKLVIITAQFHLGRALHRIIVISHEALVHAAVLFGDGCNFDMFFR